MSSKRLCEERHPNGEDKTCPNTAASIQSDDGRWLCHWHRAFANMVYEEMRGRMLDNLPEALRGLEGAIDANTQWLARVAQDLQNEVNRRSADIDTLQVQVQMLTTQVQYLLTVAPEAPDE